MVKAEWGSKHGCPKCGTRFYDLGKDDPITCIECGYAWHPDPVLKSKQPIPYEELQKKEAEGVADIYPRFSPTMEWDTAAGDAVLRAAGGMVATEDGAPLTYGKRLMGLRPFENPAFIATGRPQERG